MRAWGINPRLSTRSTSNELKAHPPAALRSRRGEGAVEPISRARRWGASRGTGLVHHSSTAMPQKTTREEPPPFLGTWPRVYAAVVIYLVAVISLFAWFGKAFSR